MESPNELIEWIQSQSGAFFNNKQEICIQDPLDPTYGTGIFASELIEKGEILCKIPENHMIQPDNDYDHNDSNVPNCSTVWALIHEMELGLVVRSWKPGQMQDFALFVKYIVGKILMTGSRLTLCKHIHEECKEGGSKDNPLYNHMVMKVVQQSEDELMIPFYDMYNHRNGHWLTMRQTFHDDDSLEISARHTVQAADILTNYGFVEQMPQYWNFLGETAVFDLDEKKGDQGTIEFTWATTLRLNPAMLTFMEEEIE
eukprot:scaffold10680_cov64-Attheya_sp.AAC.9